MTIKYLDPTTNNIRVCNLLDATVKTDYETDQKCISCSLWGFSTRINVFAEDHTVDRMMEDLFTTDKLDTTKYEYVSVGVEFEGEDDSDDEGFMDFLNTVLESMIDPENQDDVEIDTGIDPDLYDDYADPHDGDITYHDFL